MAKDLNSMNLTGRLTKDVEIKFAASGTAIAKLSIANNDSVKKNEQWQDEVSFFDVVVFGSQATNCEKYLKKGSQVAVSGRLKQNRWVDQTSGQTRSKVEILANSIQFLTPVQDNGGQQQRQQPQNNNQGQQGFHQQRNNNQGQQQQNQGFVSDPWGDNGQQQQPTQQNNGNDDDIPF